MADHYADLDARIQHFRASDAQRDALLASLVNDLRLLEKSNRELVHDLDSERTSRRQCQEKYEQINRQLVTNRNASEANCFVQVLIDGDASYFHESYIQGGEQGGVRAAAELHSMIKQHVESLFPGSDLPIMLHMFANLGGLSSLYARNGVITSPAQLFIFARGFNSSQDMFNLIDVGTGKEGADHKAREMLRIFMSNKQCKHIVFGGLHDNGYINVLRPWSNDAEKRQRITLLETLPAQQSFKDLGYPIITAPHVFKSEQPKAIPPTPAAIETPAPQLAIRTASPAGSGSTSAGANGSWSTKAATNGKEVVDVSTPKTKGMKFILKNAEDWRIDERLPQVPASIFEALKKKRDSGGNLCNDYYLLGNCPNEYTCNFNHEYKLSPGELNALRLLARNLSCPDLSYCENFKCYKGHVCIHDQRDRCTKGDKCYFADTHGADVRPAVKIYEDGRREKL